VGSPNLVVVRSSLKTTRSSCTTTLVEAGMRALMDAGEHYRAQIARHRFRAAVDATGEPLPACRALAELEWFPPVSIGRDAEVRLGGAQAALGAALDELAARLRD
jgi:hypothetical protein